ncbi:MAG: flavodoxin family protein [Holosporales bacterium]|jgi:multimeric flavodoxin WrbA
MAKSIFILGSSRSFGNTRKVIVDVAEKEEIEIIDLSTKRISFFDYEHHNKQDDFIPLIESILPYETIVLATPVYWYTMSAIMKIFIDRISDLITIRKDLGRKLSGKNLFVIASYGTSIPRGFEDAFEQTCAYMNMNYLGASFVYSKNDLSELLTINKHELAKARKLLF